MSMKQNMMNVLLVSVAAFVLWLPCVATAEPDDGFGYTISEVVARQRWPWEHKVDIDFLLTPPADAREEQLVRIGVVASNDTQEVAISADALSGTIVASEGYRRIVWDPTVDRSGPPLSHLKFFLSVSATNVIADYMTVDLKTGDVEYKEADFSAEVNTDLYKTSKMAFRYIQPGTFKMGSAAVEATLTKGFYIGVFEVTQAQWKHVRGIYPESYFLKEREMRPAETVSYHLIRGTNLGTNWPFASTVDADSFLGAFRGLTEIEKFDLPLEAQWEYACKAGTSTYFNDGDSSATVSGTNGVTNVWLNALGRYKHNGGYIDGVARPEPDCGPTNGTAIVGSYLPNRWGLYDMHGNVNELCRDWYGYTYGGVDPVGPDSYETSSPMNPFRGGSWSSLPGTCISRIRDAYQARWAQELYGFRLVLDLP